MRKSEKPLQKVTLKLYEGDFDRLRDFFPDVGASIIVRKLVHKYVSLLETSDEIPTIDIDI